MRHFQQIARAPERIATSMANMAGRWRRLHHNGIMPEALKKFWKEHGLFGEAISPPQSDPPS
jgi:hypothetical protein